MRTAGAEVRVVMTPLAKQFITPLTMTDVTCSLENPLAENVSMPFPAMLISSGAARSLSVMQESMSEVMTFGSQAPFLSLLHISRW